MITGVFAKLQLNDQQQIVIIGGPTSAPTAPLRDPS